MKTSAIALFCGLAVILAGNGSHYHHGDRDHHNDHDEVGTYYNYDWSQRHRALENQEKILRELREDRREEREREYDRRRYRDESDESED